MGGSGRSFVLTGRLDDAPCRFLLRKGQNHLGSLPASEICLGVRGVSKRHALLVLQEDRLTVEDFASKNGTFVNGKRIGFLRVHPGDELRFGPVTLCLEETSAAEGQLAISLDDKPAEPPEISFETSRVESALGSSSAERWLWLIEACIERLDAGRREDGLWSALGFLVAELGADGAAALDLDEAGRPVVVASHGEVDEDGQLPEWLTLTASEGAREGIAVRFFAVPSSGDRDSSPRGAGVGGPDPRSRAADGPSPIIVALRPKTTALVLRGGEIRESFEPYLRILLRLFEQARPRPVAGAATERALHPLRLPEGHVRGESPAMATVYRQLEKVARSDLPILILGETGVGKEGTARTVHLSSDRHDGPFVPINCAAIPSELLEAELFGIGRGVATGVAQRRGQFELADGGTLFLDEIGDMSQELQAKLLRVLQEKQLHPVGRSPVQVDVRVVAATNTDLGRRMEQGTFRSDLYYRLAGLVLTIPPLRGRREDIPALIQSFLRRFAEETGKAIRGLTVGALRRLTDRPWPGNVRELEHEIRRLSYLCPDHQAIDSTMLTDPTTEVPAPGPTPGEDHGAPAPTGDVSVAPDGSASTVLRSVDNLKLDAVEKEVVAEALRRSGGNRSRAARLLGISRESLRRRMIRFRETAAGG